MVKVVSRSGVLLQDNPLLLSQAWPTNTSTIPTPSTTSYPGRGGSSSIPTPHNPVPGSRDDSGFNGNYIPPTTNNGAYQGSTTIDKLKAGDNGVYRGHGTSTSTNVSFDTGGNSGGGAPVPPPAPAVYKFNQRDGYQSDLEKGLREVAKRAGGTLLITRTYGHNLYGNVRTPYNDIYQFKGIRKSISWKICAYNTISSGQCHQLTTITPSNQKDIKMRFRRGRTSGSDRDGIDFYKKHIAKNSISDGESIWVKHRSDAKKIYKGGIYFGSPLDRGTRDPRTVITHNTEFVDKYGLRFHDTTSSEGYYATMPDQSYWIKTNPRHYEITFK